MNLKISFVHLWTWAILVLAMNAAGSLVAQAPSTTPQTPAAAEQVQDEAKTQEVDDLDGLLDGLDLGNALDDIPTIPDASQRAEPEPSDESASGGAMEKVNTFFEAFQSMKEAEQLLAQGQADQNVVDAQQRAVQLLDELIKAQLQEQQSGQQSQTQQNQQQSRSQQQSSEQTSELEQSQNQQQPEVSDQSDQQDASDASAGDNTPNGRGEASEEQQPISAAGTVSPLNAAGQGIWGHLPQKTRGMLRAEIPTDYLPGYSKQISDYFKALAEMPSE